MKDDQEIPDEQATNLEARAEAITDAEIEAEGRKLLAVHSELVAAILNITAASPVLPGAEITTAISAVAEIMRMSATPETSCEFLVNFASDTMRRYYDMTKIAPGFSEATSAVRDAE